MLPRLALLPACALIHRRKVGVHIAGISAASGNFLARRRNLTQRVGVVRDIGQDNKNMHSAVECEIFRGGQAPYLGVAIRSMAGSFARFENITVLSIAPVLLEALDEEVRLLEGYTHSRKDNGELFVYRRAPLPDARSAPRGLRGADRMPEKIGSF